MGEKLDINEYRRRKNRTAKLRRRITAISIVASIIVIALLISVFTPLVAVDLSDYMASSRKRGGGYPVSFSIGKVLKADDMKNTVAVLSDNVFAVYNNAGAELQNIAHGYASPDMECGGARAVVYNRGSRELMLFERSKMLKEEKYSYPIIAAAVSNNGCYAVLTESDGYTAELHVSNSYGEERFIWYCTNAYPIRVEFSHDNRFIAVSAVYSDGGALSSTVYVIDAYAAKQTGSMEFYDNLVLKTVFVSSGTVIAVGDNYMARTSIDGTVEKSVEYKGRELLTVAADEGRNIALVFGNNGSPGGVSACAYTYSLEPRFESVVGDSVYDAYLEGSRLELLTSDGVITLSLSGKEYRRTEISARSCMLVKSKRLLLVSHGGISLIR